MSSNIKIEKGQLIVDIDGLVDGLPFEERREVLRRVWFDSYFVKDFLDLIVDGGLDYHEWYFGGDTIHEIRSKLLPLMDRISADEIKKLTEKNKQLDEDRRAEWSKCWNLEKTVAELTRKFEQLEKPPAQH